MAFVKVLTSIQEIFINCAAIDRQTDRQIVLFF